MNNRRRSILVLTAVALAAPFPGHTQQPAKTVRVGRLSPISASVDAPTLAAFRKALQELGWVEGRNLAIESRFAEGRLDRLPALAAELVQRGADVIVGISSEGAAAALKATSSIPIVVTMTGDPIESGLVRNLARPGGNLTGVTALGLTLSEKRLELLKEAVPGVKHVGVLLNPEFQDNRFATSKFQSAAKALGLQLTILEITDPAGLDRAFAALRKERVEVLAVPTDPLMFVHRKRIIELAAAARLPAMYAHQGYIEVGGLMFYGESLPDMHRRAAYIVDKILRGAKPADLPFEQAAKFELVINLRAARALGITIPQSVLIRADRVIE
jgi:putative ABC transport system substrate-binding protein